MTTFRQFSNDDITLRIETPGPRARKFGDTPPMTPKDESRLVRQWEDCDVTWVEWSGKLANPTGMTRTATGVTVRDYGMKSVELSGGTLPFPMRKKLSTPGFQISQAGVTVDIETRRPA